MEGIKTEFFSNVDSFIHARQARWTLSVSPVSQMLAFLDWAVNLADSPRKKYELTEEYVQSCLRSLDDFVRLMIRFYESTPEKPVVTDNRFKDEAWQQWPYNLLHNNFHLIEKWWQKATTGVPGVSNHHQNMVYFSIRQILDMLSPANFLTTNPVLRKVTQEERGQNFLRGWSYFLEDWWRLRTNQRLAGAEAFKVGKNVAVTPGKVVLRTPLMELIQYSPTTKKVFAEPVLIIPAWIMKYYILDLSPQNSLVKYMVDKGHTVFMVSWKNPDEEDRDLGMEDYRVRGVMAAVDAVSKIIPGEKIHSVGYCLGGTLMVIAAATMARDNDDRLKTMTLLATQTDFTEAGELMLFIDENQINYLEDIMWDKGYLDTKQMAGAFQMLRSQDLLWSRIIQDYLMGQRRPLSDLMAWNADTTRMPYRMHSEYLRKIFLHNDLFQGRYRVSGRNIVISDIHIPVFLVGTTQDHVAPWRSVYKFHLISNAKTTTFVLTSGGHNAGIISEPNNPRRTYQMSTVREGERYKDADRWLEETPKYKGSWWLPWQEWLVTHSSEGQIPPPSVGAAKKGLRPLLNAPGSYVFQE